MACIAARHHAVEQINAAVHRFQNICRRAHTHQVADLILRHMLFNRFNHFIHDLCRLADRKAANSITIEPQFRNLLHVVHAQVDVCAALVDAEQHLVWVDRIRQRIQSVHLRLAAAQPACCACAGIFRVVVFRRVFHAFVKRHGDGRTEVGLNTHAFLRAHEDAMAVDV